MEEMKPTLLCVGVDLAKKSHVAAFVSQRSQKVDAHPLAFDNSRAGFEQLLEVMGRHAPPDQCAVLVEKTGHYGISLEQFLQEHNVALYRTNNQKRLSKQKTDEFDAKALSNLLFNQVVAGARGSDLARIHRVQPPTESAARLNGLAQYQLELTEDITRVSNRLTALCDEGFTEFTEVFADPNGPTALAFREKFPTPADVAAASIEELLACRPHTRPGNAGLVRLRDLAKNSIGNRNPARLRSLCLEQKHLIKRLRSLQADIDVVEAEITEIVENSREGKILTSIPGISPVAAGVLIGSIGSIANFERASSLRGYCGWSPIRSQSGTSLDSTTLDRGGNRLLKRTIHLAAWSCIRQDTEFRAIYERLVPIKCRWDEQKHKYYGKNKVVGRICGQLIGLIFLLLRRDYDMLAALREGAMPPEPMLYSREVHRQARMGRDYIPWQPLRSKNSVKKRETKPPSGPARVWLLLEQDATLASGELARLANCDIAAASRTRKKFFREKGLEPPRTTTDKIRALLEEFHGDINLVEVSGQLDCDYTLVWQVLKAWQAQQSQHSSPAQ